MTTLIGAVLGPVLGTLADTKGFKKPIFVAFIAVGVVGCIGMGFTSSWLVFLIIFILAKVGYSGSLIFYDSMLPDITTEKRMDDVSSQGYAWGYIGSCVPFLASLVLVLMYDKIGITMNVAMTIAFVIIAVWWVGMTIPLLRIYQQKHYVERQPNAFKESFLRIGRTLRDVKKHKKIFLFLLAFFFYIDGVYTIIDMATAYGSALGLDTTGLLLALLGTQVVAFPLHLLVVGWPFPQVVQHILCKLLELRRCHIFPNPLGIEPGLIHTDQANGGKMILKGSQIPLGIGIQPLIQKLGDNLPLGL